MTIFNGYFFFQLRASYHKQAMRVYLVIGFEIVAEKEKVTTDVNLIIDQITP